MLEMVKGCYVPKNELLSEQYIITDYGFMANVNASKIKKIIEHFINMQNDLLFFILELPANQNDEEKLRKSESDPSHKDIYYIDGLNAEQASALMTKYGQLLINDGLCKFGFGVHDNSAEIMSADYNVMTILTNSIDRYKDFFKEHNISHTDNLITAWNTFSQDNPGQCSSIMTNGILVYNLPQELADWGIYLAEQREED